VKMKLKSNQPTATAEHVVKDIRRATRWHYSTEDKIRVVLSGLRGVNLPLFDVPLSQRIMRLS
jgi:hypothetical protein